MFDQIGGVTPGKIDLVFREGGLDRTVCPYTPGICWSRAGRAVLVKPRIDATAG